MYMYLARRFCKATVQEYWWLRGPPATLLCLSLCLRRFILSPSSAPCPCMSPATAPILPAPHVPVTDLLYLGAHHYESGTLFIIPSSTLPPNSWPPWPPCLSSLTRPANSIARCTACLLSPSRPGVGNILTFGA